MRTSFFFGVYMTAVLAIVFGFVGIQSAHGADPDGWDTWWLKTLGIKTVAAYLYSDYALSDEEAKAAGSLGLNPQVVAMASSVEAWMNEQYGEGAGDRAVYIALTSGESANCTNAGKGYALAEMQARGFAAQIQAFYKLLEIWQRNDIRALNPTAAQYIPADYNAVGVIGSIGAGALGCSQFMAGTASIHLDLIGEPFDLWNPLTAMQVMALEVHRLGWNKNLSFVSKVQVLLGWNNHPTWIKSIVSSSEQNRGILGAVVDQASGVKDALSLFGSYQNTNTSLSKIGVANQNELTGWRYYAKVALEFLGLMPEVPTYRVTLGNTLTEPVTGATTSVALDLSSEVPQNDGEKENVIKWAELNDFTIQPGGTWDFCTQTNLTGWNYGHAAGVPAGGICFNASVIRELANSDPDLEVVSWVPHADVGWARLHTVIWCPGTPLRIRNNGSTQITVRWSRSGENLIVSTHSVISLDSITTNE